MAEEAVEAAAVLGVEVVGDEVVSRDLATGGQSIQTCLRVSGRGARCISGGAEELSSVRNPPPARGRTFSPPKTSETGASSTNLQKNQLLTTE